jgi:hypothetical protein
MLDCDRCGLDNKKGQSSVCIRFDSADFSKEDYERDNENDIREKLFKSFVMAGYNSKYDNAKIEFSKQFKNEYELRETYPWIGNIGEEYDNLCDDCVSNMLINKELIYVGGIDDLRTPFYTSCCDKLITEFNYRQKYYDLRLVNIFPYLSYYVIENEQEFVCVSSLNFPYHLNSIICENCYKNLNNENMIYITDHPVNYTLKELRNNVEQYIKFDLRGTNIDYKTINVDPTMKKFFENSYHNYYSKKNNLLIKKELSKYIARRNINILRTKFSLCKDIVSMILGIF